MSRRVCLWAFGVGLSRSGASRPPAAPDLRGRTPRRRRIRVSRGNRRRAAAWAPGRVARSARSEGLPPAARRGRRALARRLAAVLPPAEAAALPRRPGPRFFDLCGQFEVWRWLLRDAVADRACSHATGAQKQGQCRGLALNFWIHLHRRPKLLRSPARAELSSGAARTPRAATPRGQVPGRAAPQPQSKNTGPLGCHLAAPSARISLVSFQGCTSGW